MEVAKLGRYKDLSGMRFGRLVVVCDTGERSKSKKVLWFCRCDCGQSLVTEAQNLIIGDTRSCGCLKTDKITTHKMTKTRLYRRWADMLSRCRNPNLKNYHNYGGRGIEVCDEWQEYEAFAEWSLANGYRGDLIIDRINVDGNYEPGNCRWTTRKVSDNNRRDSIRVNINGRAYTPKELSKIAKVTHQTMLERIRRGESGESLLLPSHQGVSLK